MTEEEFGTLYSTLYAQIYGFAARRVGPEAAKDLVADTFEVAWRKRHDFPVDSAKWAAWVVGIAKNKVLQEAQRRVRKHHDNRFADDWTPQREAQNEDVSRQVIEKDAGLRVYLRLEPAEKYLFDVAFFRDLTASQAAEMMGISMTAFTTRLSRLRRRINGLMDEELSSLGNSSDRDARQ